MTAAFRNFILTLVLSLAVFGYAAYKILPEVTSILFESFENSETDTSDVSNNTDESSNDSQDTSDDTSKPIDVVPEEYSDFNCFFLAKNDMGDICSAIYIRVNEKTGKYVVCTIPWNINLDNSGRLTPLYDLLGAKGAEFSIRKLSAIAGIDVPYYVVLETKDMQALAKTLNSAMIELTYDITFIHPDFAELPEELINESHYVTLKQGRNAFTELYAPFIFNAQQLEDTKDYAFQQNMAVQLYKNFFTSTNISKSNIQKLFEQVTTNIPAEDFDKFCDMLLTLQNAESANKLIQLNYPMTRDVIQSTLFIPDWNKGITSLAAAEK